VASDLALIFGGVALYAVAGTALAGLVARWVNAGERRLAVIVPLGFAGPFGLVCASYGTYRFYRHLGLEEYGLPMAACTAGCLSIIGLVVGALLLTAGSGPEHGDDGGGGRDDGLPPPPDSDGPDGWAEFERQFRVYARERDRQFV
jgi:hypothetical protein